MTLTTWVKLRAVELGAALWSAGIPIAGVVIGVPFLRARIAETFLYSVCGVVAVVLRAVIDLALRGAAVAARNLRTPAPVTPGLKPTGA